MIEVIWTKKILDKKGKTIGYALQDINGNVQEIKLNELKKEIHNNQIAVLNLKLTSNNQLRELGWGDYVKRAAKIQTIQKKGKLGNPTDQEMHNMIVRAKILGLPIEEMTTACGGKCYLIHKTRNEHIVIIPSTVAVLNGDRKHQQFTTHIRKLTGKISIWGGCNLLYTYCMFRRCIASELDLTHFNTSSISNMNYMFEHCEAKSINFTNFDTSNVECMNGMFEFCSTPELNLSNFNTSKVENMGNMFLASRTTKINLSNFNTSNVEKMDCMFEHCQAEKLDLRSFNTSKVKDMSRMFNQCKADYIDVSSFDTTNVEDWNSMFGDCRANKLDLRSFKIEHIGNYMETMFSGCKSSIQATDQTLIEMYEYR